MKIRAWSKIKKEFLILSDFNNYFKHNLKYSIKDSTITLNDDYIIWNAYVNRKDRNDKDIYVGDIVKVIDRDTKAEKIYEIKLYTFLQFRDIFSNSYIEVIGNIYENIDLLPTQRFDDDDILQEKTVIHCNTKEKASELCEWLNYMGLKWCDGINYAYTNWSEFKEQTCYSVLEGCFGSLDFYLRNNYNILTYDDVKIDKE